METGKIIGEVALKELRGEILQSLRMMADLGDERIHGQDSPCLMNEKKKLVDGSTVVEEGG